MPIEPSELRAAPAEVVLVDRPCAKCGYNVKGLRVGERCPECGAPIGGGPRRTTRFADNLTESPMWYLLVVTGGTVAMAISLVGSFAFSVYLSAQSMNFTPLPTAAVAVASLAFAGLWVVGVGLVTAKRPHGSHTVPDAILDSSALRWGARGAQVIFASAVVARFAATTGGSASVGTLASVLEFLSLLALAPLCVYLGSLSDWAGDTNGGDRLRNATWAFVVAGTGALVFGVALKLPVSFKILLAVGFVLCMIGVFIGIVLFVISVVALAVTAGWAVQNAGEARAREARIAERKQRQLERDRAEAERREANAARQMAERAHGRVEHPVEHAPAVPLAEREDARDDVDRALESLSPGSAPLPASPPLPGHETGVDPRRPRSAGEHVIAPVEGIEGYELAPEDDGRRR